MKSTPLVIGGACRPGKITGVFTLGDDAPLKYQLKPVTLEGRQHIHKLVILVGDNDNAVGGALRAAHVGPTS